MAELIVMRPPALVAAAEKRGADAALLRKLADDVEAGKVDDVVAISRSQSEGYEVMATSDKWSTVAMARVLDAWAVGRVFK
ncbi:MAG: hypothetical protein JWQ03_1623 [Variovorax sp.]|nr:hypothetical protein [Variovorax sp.]